MGNELVTINYDYLVRTTEDAYLFDIGDDQVWVPKSLVSDLPKNHEIELAEWFVLKEGLEDYII